jgi:hypothetical protein
VIAMNFGQPYGIANFTLKSMLLQAFECRGPILCGQEKVQVFGSPAYSGVLEQCVGAGHGVWNALSLKRHEYFSSQCFLLFRKFRGNRRGYWQSHWNFVSWFSHSLPLPLSTALNRERPLLAANRDARS